MSSVSSEVEERPLEAQAKDSSSESSKKPIRSYSRDFLLSLSGLEVCKKLPEGFDASLLSEFGTQDRPRALGSSSQQGFKRPDYGSSLPARGDSGSYSRGLNRWDSRSSGRSDTDTDSESGRRYGGQARRSWQGPEHDGLLGSGSFPRPAGFAAGAPAPRFRPNDNIHLNRSNEPYQPPRPYKAIPHSRREANDSFNDETFGSADDASEDRVEEEKKRRAEFELMRKEQQKSLQEKHKFNKGKSEDPFSDFGQLDNSSDGKASSDLDKVLKQTPQEDFNKLSVPSQAPPSRPLVPPGFVSSVDKSSIAKSMVHAELLEIETRELEDSHQDVKNKIQGRDFGDPHSQICGTSVIKAEKVKDLSSVLQSADLAEAKVLPGVNEVLEDGEIIGIDFEATKPPNLLGEPACSTSILDKLFGNASTVSNNNTSKFVEDNAETDGIWTSNMLQSKFSNWFPEDDRKHPVDVSSEKSNSLLSLFVGGEKGGSNVPDISPMESVITPGTEVVHNMSNSYSATAELSEQFSNSSYATEKKPAVLTCEDLEQSILSEFGGDKSDSQPDHALDVKVGHPTNNVDNQASQHLLSLLQRGIGSKDVPSVSLEERTTVKPFDQEVGQVDVLDGSVNDANRLPNPAKTLTLESLFGTAFMNELHSAQGNASNSARTDNLDGVLFPSVMNGNGINHSASNNGEWLGFNDAIKDVEFSKQSAVDASKFTGIDRGFQVALPEEDSLINLVDPINAQNSMSVNNSGSYDSDLLPSSSSIPVDVMEKLVALGGTPRHERSMVGGHDPRLLHSPFDMVNPELGFQNLHPPTSSLQHHASQMNYSRPLFHGLDSHPAHLDPQLNFVPPEAIIHHDAPAHHQFPANMGHPSITHPSSGLTGFDRPIPAPILQQMHMAGNLPPPRLARGFPGSAPVPLHPSHNPAGYVQESNPVQNFPFGQRQSFFGGPGMGPTGPEHGVSDNPPEAFQRLLEMELRANPKQMHPYPFAAGASRAMYGHELDTGLRYR
ncbi:uncharacterized protein LOC130811359 [Amaranthus tricolor]|uniref:uncharacterized protein LOC130811359 n=1 Tax=Amaranthus tricolor TaxID=29722 RepID=UPI00258E75F6|nr:uncharacterized protein LOC130811359 [Amaranthus tricolor]XP_057533618.1 uncharacterized protein LOC130811359 [Amaranthus tricolor]